MGRALQGIRARTPALMRNRLQRGEIIKKERALTHP